MQIADSHNHLHFRSFRKDLSAVLERAHAAGVHSMLLVGIDPEDSSDALSVASTHEGLLVSIGIHPSSAKEHTVDDVMSLKGLFSSEGPVAAVGETGFDLYHTPETEHLQRDMFAAHIDLARMLSLPIVIHDRMAHSQTLKVMDEMDAWRLGGVFHCFSGNALMAARIIENGFFISIPGVVTFKNAADLREVVKMCPMESLLVETDAPFLAPMPYRGKRNEPSYLVHVLKEMAEIKECTVEDMARKTTENFLRLFVSCRKNRQD